MKIILCSAKDSIRERWLSLLQNHGFSVYQASSPQMLNAVVRKNEKYLLLLHQPFIELPIIARLCAMNDSFKVFVLSDTPNKGNGIVLLKKGVVGYANSYISEGRLVQAVKTVMSGRVWFKQEVLVQFVRSVNAANMSGAHDDSDQILQGLTEREREIAGLIAQGLSNKNIADRLYISERTVKSHLGAIFQKTGAKSRVQLALRIQRQKNESPD